MNTEAQIDNALGNITGGRVLDVATGTGTFIHLIADKLNSYEEFIGIDTINWPAKVEESIFDREDVHFAQMDAHKMDFEDASFDTVGINVSLHHMSDPLQVLAEMKRVLKPGGHFIIAEMYSDGLTEPQLTHLHLHHWCAEIDTALGDTHDPTFTRREIVDMVEGVGLRNLAFYDYADLDGKPKDENVVNSLSSAIDHYLKRAEGLPEYEALKERGEEIQRRLNEVGFLGATQLVVIGQK